MKENHQALRTAILVIAVVLAVTALLLALFFGSSSKQPEQSITLPDAPVSQTPEEPVEQPEQTQFAEITRDNVQSVIKSLTSPSSYHQTLTILTYANGATRQQQADIWRSGDLIRANVSEESGVKSILSDGKTVYLWYEDDQTPLELSMRDDMTPEQLIGIPSTDALLQISPQQIESAEFVTLQEDASLSCIYVIFTQADCTQYFWIDVTSGLLCRQSIQQQGQNLYVVQQNRLDILMDGDEVLSDAFCLPDGTEPFAR